MITCADAVKQLWDYLDHALDREDRERIEEHLAFCRTCCGELEFAKELQNFLASNTSEEIPADIKKRLQRFVDDLGEK